MSTTKDRTVVDWVKVGVKLPRRGAYSDLPPLKGAALDGVVRFLATSHFDAKDPTWPMIDPSYDPETAHGWTTKIGNYLMGYKAGTDVLAMRSPEWQAVVNSRR